MRPLVAETQKVGNIGRWYMVRPFKPNAVNRRIHSECLRKGQAPMVAKTKIALSFGRRSDSQVTCDCYPQTF